MGIGFKLERLSRNFGEKRALDGVSCEFPQGAISAVIGPNGGGKTTLLRLIARLDMPGAGSISYLRDGAALPLDGPLMRKLTLVSQRPTLFRMSVRRNVEYGLRARGLSMRDAAVRADEAIEACGLGHIANSDATRLSGGEAQRVALARAYVLRPEAVLLDEPTASLDPDNTILAEKLIRSMNSDFGTTVVMVTHNLFQARRLSGRSFFIMDGALVEEAQTDDFFSAPKDPLTRRYISGEMIY